MDKMTYLEARAMFANGTDPYSEDIGYTVRSMSMGGSGTICSLTYGPVY